MDSFANPDYASSLAAHLAVDVDGGPGPSGDGTTPLTSRSVSPVFSCPSPTSSVSSFAQSTTTTVEELADKLSQTGVVPRPPPSSARKLQLAERRRTDRLHPTHHDLGPARRHAAGRHHHDSRRWVGIGSLAERMMSADPQHARQGPPSPPGPPGRPNSAATRATGLTAASDSAFLGLAIDSGVPVDPLELVSAALQGRVRLGDVAKSCRRRLPGAQRDVRVRKKPRIRPRP